MTPREKIVVRAIIRALSRNVTIDMDAFATSYRLPEHYTLARPKARAAMLLQALLESES